MDRADNLDIFKALADKSRLAIVQSLLARPHYLEELAERHALAPSTVSFHLRKLEQAGLVTSRKEQYYVMVAAQPAAFDATLRELIAAAPSDDDAQQARVVAYRRKVLDTFFAAGRLKKLPAQQKKRLIVLQQFAGRFERDRRYDETEVTALIRPLHDDYCTIRRLLVDENLIRRDAVHYWREIELDAPEPALPAQNNTRNEKQMNSRKEKIREYRESRPSMGIYALRCHENDKLYVAASSNLDGERNSRLFQLRMGKAIFSPELQSDLQRYGAAAFAFEVLATLDPKTEAADVDRQLALLELEWLEKLQPFDDNGYNSRKRFARECEKFGIGN